MTKKKPSPQNRIWEKERRERLNKTFEDLQQLLPDNEPASTLSKIEILQRAIELIGKLQKKIKDLTEECNDPLKEHVREQEDRLKKLLTRNVELIGLLKKAKVTIPPCKYTVEHHTAEHIEEKENGTPEKKRAASKPQQRRSGSGSPRKQSVIKKPVAVVPPTSGVVSPSLALSNIQSATVPSSGGTSVTSTSSSMQSTSPTGMNSSALRHLNGVALSTGNRGNISVPPALLPTPIMTTSVLISNNGNLVQMPIVAPPSSLLIVGNEDVRAKLNLKKRCHGGGGGKGRAKIGKFTIKSIDLIPGRIVNGKVPIPPLRRAPHETMRTACKVLKRKRKKSTEKCKKLRKTVTEEPVSKGNMPDQSFEEAEKSYSNSGSADVQPCSNPVVAEQSQASSAPEQPALSVAKAATEEASGVPAKDSNHSNVNPQEAELDLTTLNHADLSEDIFATLQVPSNPDAHGSHDAGSLSPTAAYLMNFPLVAGGGKAAGNHTEQTDEVDEACNESLTKEHAPTHKDTASGIPDTGTGTLMLDNFSSLFNYTQVDAAATGTVEPLPSTTAAMTTTSISQTTKDQSSFTTNYANMYQSIDTMLEHRTVDPNRTVGLKMGQNDVEQDSNLTGAFTFTLTSSTTTAPLTTHQRCSTSNQHHFYTPSVGTTSSTLPADKKGAVSGDTARKSPSPLAIEFTFSLTTTTATQPRTVQSQYTNSAMLSSTMTTPSYDTYGYYHTTVNNKSGSYGGNGSFKVPLDPLPGTICTTTEKPATSFTFCLTSSTKTQPSYAQSFTASVASTTSMFESPPKLSTKQQAAQGKDCASVGLTKHQPFSVPSRPGKDASGQSTEAMATHQQHAMQSQQQQPTQSKYDVSWMAAGAHDCKTGDQPVVTQSFHHQQQTGLPYQQQQHHQQHQQPEQQQHHQQLSYDFTPQIFSSAMDFPTAAGGYTANFEPHHQRKSDIFFAHPPGEENGLGVTGSWSSANKLTDSVLNDSSTPYFPSVTVPPLSGESEPNASASASSRAVQGGGKATSGKKRHTTTHQETTATSVSVTGSSFLSVSQLVDQPTKTTYHHHHHTPSSSGGGVPAGIPSSSAPCQQKPNSYSAEALIGNTTCTVPSTSGPAESNGRKEKLFDYGAGGEMATGANSSLTFNFDTYGATGPDYGKSYNFSNQFVESSTNYGGLPSTARRSGGTSTGSGLYYGKAATGTTQSYYHHTGHSDGSGGTSTYHHLPPSSTGAEFTPYYLPAFAEKTNPANGATAEKQYPGAHGEQANCRNSTKKSQKTVGILPVADYAFSTAPSDAASNVHPGGPLVNGSQGQSLPYANYHYHQQQQPELQQQQHHHHDPHQQHQRLQHQHYGTIEGSNVPHKSSLQSGTSYNYGQYPSTPAPIGFDTPKPAKLPMQLSSSALLLPGDDGTGLHPPTSSYATVSHAPHLEIAPPCFNAPPPPTVGYGVNPSSSQVSLYGGHGQLQASGTHSSATGGTITDFNLSTICPEIDEKTGRTATVAGRNGAQVASIMSLW
ncbi:mucin-5AC-like [Anopheles cruzii]|uniref:mucin-5AC-like n=1 Tax=Anopheles cruzii TaxID=68878 RepID=UPI0022EC59AB|nr:mucin-5AC-like [Anopheles cruzii]